MLKQRASFIVLFVLVVSFVLAACQPAPTPTVTPQPVEVATEVVEAVDAAATEAANLVDEALAEATEAAEDVEALATEAVEGAEALATEAAEAVEDALAEATEVASAIESVVTDALAEATEVAEGVDAVATEVVEAVEAVATEVVEVVEAVATEVVEETTDVAGDLANAVTIAPDGNVVIGVAVGLSGEGIAPLGIDIQRGVELALEDRPTVTVGGVEFAVSLDAQDDLCSAEGGQAVANRFTSDGNVIGVVGPMCSSACLAAAPIFDAAGYTTISPSCTGPVLTTSGFASFNRSVASDGFQGLVAASYIYNELGARTIATIHDGSAYGEGLVSVVAEAFVALGGEVVSADAVTVGDTDFRGLLEDVAQASPDLIYFVGFPAEAARLAEQRADVGLEDTPLMGADGIRGTEIVELAGSSAEGVYASAPISASSEALDAFLARYIETYGEEPPAPYHANGYDAANILLDGIEAVGSVDADGNLVVDRAALAEYVRGVAGVEGLTGVLSNDGTGELSAGSYGISVVTDGAFAQIATGTVAEGEVTIEAVEAEAVTEEPAETEAEETEAVATEEAEEVEAVATEETEAVEAEETEVAEAEEAVATEVMEEETTDVAADLANAVTIAPDGNVVIGVAVGLSGEGIAPLGIDIQRGVELALEDRPTVTVGGVEFAVSLDAQDDLCSAEGGQAVANRFTSDGNVIGVVGPMCSSACLAAAPIFDAAGYTTISPSCTGPVLTTSGFASFNRSVASDGFQGLVAASYIYNELGARTIATIHDGSAYGEGLVSVVAEAFVALGGEVVSADAVTVGDTDFRGLLEDVAQASPDLIYFVGFPAEAARLAEQRADVGLEDTPLMGADGIRGTEIVELAGSSAEGVYASAPISASSEALDAFLARYIETYGEEPPAPYHANGYDAANILLDGIEAVGSVDADGNLVVDRAALAEYVRGVAGVEGLTGVLSNDGTGELSAGSYGISVVTDGAFAQIATGTVAEGEVTIEAVEAEAEAEVETEAEVTPEATEAA